MYLFGSDSCTEWQPGGCSCASPKSCVPLKLELKNLHPPANQAGGATCRFPCVLQCSQPNPKPQKLLLVPFPGVGCLEAKAWLSCTAGTMEPSDPEASHHRYGVSKRGLLFFFWSIHAVRISFCYPFWKPGKYFYDWSVKSSSSVYMIHAAASQNQHCLPEGGWPPLQWMLAFDRGKFIQKTN